MSIHGMAGGLARNGPVFSRKAAKVGAIGALMATVGRSVASVCLVCVFLAAEAQAWAANISL